MIEYISTRSSNIKATPSMAILSGQASDGGLYVPSDLEGIKLNYRELMDLDFKGMARLIWGKFFDDYGADVIDELVERSYNGKFSSDEITPLSKVGQDYVLELYHGPTAAFKDVALSALPNLLTKARTMNCVEDTIMILTATSGDTGSAAMAGFSGVEGTGIIVFYPEGGTSETQRLQMVTDKGSNTSACAIRGNFDDAQSGVKKIFREMSHPAAGVSLSSANSINIGRLVPQIVYYFYAYSRLLFLGAIKDGNQVDFIVPTGNFGDIMAGYYAYRMGLPIRRLVCASNKNKVLTDFIKTGHYDKKRDFYKTSSPSMDILISSNLERLLYYVCGEDNTAKYMKQLEETGEYTVTTSELEEIQSIFDGVFADEDEAYTAIRNVYETESYLMDTHTSVAWACKDKYDSNGAAARIVLSTASPYKFCPSVLEALGLEISESDKVNMETCKAYTGAPVPKGLSDIFDRPLIHGDVIDKEDMKSYVEGKISGLLK